jgi:hypothetical protein
VLINPAQVEPRADTAALEVGFWRHRRHPVISQPNKGLKQ